MTDSIHRHAGLTIAAGSSSFAAAARLLDPATRRNAVLLYTWCRHCDDVIDGQFLGGPGRAYAGSPADRLARLEEQTRRAYVGPPPDDPAFQAFSEVSRGVGLPMSYPLEHLAGYRMDVEGRSYGTLDDLLLYCWRVAGVVGVMMSMTMGRRQSQTLDRAADLGIAFQLTNIARDVVEDALTGRVYLPRLWLEDAGIPADRLADPAYREPLAGVVARLLDAAEPYYASARLGLSHLPLRSAWAIGTALDVYRAIGVKVRRRGAAAWDERVRTSGPEKIGHAASAGVGVLVSRHRGSALRDPTLWTRPV
ncbi:phytoene/squalene synthase family protein [Chthonobacter albigriseus]|uniref:phytoene/squalene synthase family protein n=1 Tax=Chthonobacter albigriseus TaxID=1683161 RepID=UPI0015EF26F3|nr:phytoene/squalene synthase family protein [Chthonobacter albigriseus]